MCLYNWINLDSTIVKCIIPKGSELYYGNYNDVVSNQIIIVDEN